MNNHTSFLLSMLYCMLAVPLWAQPTASLENIRQAVRAELLQAPIDENRVEELLATQLPDGSWPGINYTDTSRTGFDHRRHLDAILLMGLAFQQPGSAYFRQPVLKNALMAAIEHWLAHDYIAANWHTNEIGNPQKWVHFLLIMDEDLPQEQATAIGRLADRANLNAWGARPGGDLIKIASIMGEMALYRRDTATLKRVVQVMGQEIRIGKGKGIQPDLSFHHRYDRVTSTLSYGTGYAAAFAKWAARLQGTPYRFPEESIQLLVDYYLDGICKTLVHGAYKDPGAINRSMSRPHSLKPVGPEIPQNLLKATNYRQAELQNILHIRQGEQRPNLSGNRFFWHSEYHSHQRPTFFTSVRMYSNRCRTMEYPHNMESLKMHHYADGSNFLSQSGQEYYDIFPVWDWQKIPGTTVLQKPALPSWREIVKEGTTSFAGGISDGMYGATALDFRSAHDPLSARKAWFFFDQAYVCLGAGIQAESPHQVATTLNQCLLNGPVSLKSGGQLIQLAQESHTSQEVSWVHHDQAGYLFFAPTTVHLSNQSRQGSWASITRHSARSLDELIEKQLFTLWLDHGQRPQHASYAYQVVPAVSVQALQAYADAGPVRILANTPSLQAVQHRELQLTQMVFYEAGTMEISKNMWIKVKQPALLMLKMKGGKIAQIWVADPSRQLSSFELEIPLRLQGKGEQWEARWNAPAAVSHVRIQLPNGPYAGSTAGLYIGEDGRMELKGQWEAASLTAQAGPGKGRHFVGEVFGGGRVIWVDESGEHGLIATTTDQHSGIRWDNGPARHREHYGDHQDRFVNARADGIGAGRMNSLLIIAQQTQDSFFGEFAAKVCHSCQAGGYGDWYLPAKAELELLFRQKELLAPFGSNLYWSSTEYNVGFVWGQHTNVYGNVYTLGKGSRAGVRCVRRF
ncbi:MAG: DUF1566 domain-containing protein [Bacteroidetes bacterium]|nr:MAG: DUF1566 domain-containing protein [Bacteroidota bacterium]